MRSARPGGGWSPPQPGFGWTGVTLPPTPAPPEVPGIDGGGNGRGRGKSGSGGGGGGGGSGPPAPPSSASAPPGTAPSPLPPHPPVAVAVVGGGRMGHIRLAAIVANPRMTLSVFVDADADVGSTVAARYGVPVRTSLRSALSDFPATTGVWVATPTPTHAPLIAEAAAAGVHVAVEKPVSDSLGGVAAAYAAARSAGVHLYCAFQRRFDPAYAAVASAVARGACGAVASAVGVFRDHPPPPASFFAAGGGDLYLDLGVHDVDFLCHMLGEAPVGVTATEAAKPASPPPPPPEGGRGVGGGAPLPNGVGGGGASRGAAAAWANGGPAAGDVAAGGGDGGGGGGGQAGATGVLTLWYPSGAVATLLLSRVSATGYDQRLEVHGSAGSARVDNPPVHAAVVSTDGRASAAASQHSFPQRFREAFDAEVDHFADLVTGRAVSPVVSESDAAVSLAVALAGGMSAADGGRPVRLAEVWSDARLDGSPSGGRGAKRRRGGGGGGGGGSAHAGGIERRRAAAAATGAAQGLPQPQDA